MKMRIDESLQEENEKKQKDIMAFYLQLLKLRQLKQKDRIQRYMEKVEELLKSMRCEGKIK